ncbi:glycosyltransferase family 2 protein [Jiulongibacter sp. NS-SX5]|uniref:glycosyltransferase family 2 protein n=1 Tax=Jiulongibacter sp. NS-SX5 TaxID=3463854 RepID=UPI0040585885
MAKHFAIITPCFNEGETVDIFLSEVQDLLFNSDFEFTIYVIDDHSTDDTLTYLKEFKVKYDNVHLKIIRLKYNMGHQEAIRQGLLFINHFIDEYESVIVMDSDGEDDPAAILKGLEFDEYDIIVFERGKRNEGWKFQIGYLLYKVLFRIVTGKSITFGNYSILKANVVRAISQQKFYHFPGFLSKQKYRIKKIKFDRRSRINGVSKMSYNGLVLHGLKSLVEYSEELLYFFIKNLVVLISFSLIFGLVVLYKKFISHEAILGWASNVGIGLIQLILVISTFLASSLLLLSIKNMLKKSDENLYELIRD